MKKCFNILLVIGLLLMAIFFLVPVYAEGGNEEVIIEDVRQNNNILEYTNNAYQVTDFKYNPQVLFYIKNAKKHTYYNVYFYSNQEDYTLVNVYNNTNDREYYENELTMYASASSYTIKLCLTDAPDSKTCTEEISTKSITIDYTNYNKLNFDGKKLLVTKVMQGENEIEPIYEDNNCYYNINSLDEVKVSLEGTNFDGTVTYEIDVNNHKMYYSGNLLNDGITVSGYPAFEDHLAIAPIFPLNGAILDIKNEYETNAYNVIFNYNATTNNNLKYTVMVNSPNIDPIAYQNNKIINFSIRGNNTFEDRDYLVKVYLSSLDMSGDSTVLYSEEKTIGGLAIRDGYNYSIEDVTLPIPKKTDELGVYLVTVVIEGSSKSEGIFFKGNGTLKTSHVYYSDNMRMLKPLSAMGHAAMFKETFSFDALSANGNKIYISYETLDPTDDPWYLYANKEYNYKLTHGYLLDDETVNLMYEEEIKTGTVQGAKLNAGEFTLLVNVPSQIMAPSKYKEVYRLAIYDGDMIVNFGHVILIRNYNSTVSNYQVRVKGNVVDPRGYNDYLVSNEYPLVVQINGVGFDNEKEYDLNIIESRTNMRECAGSECENQLETVLPHDGITVTGEELNNGYVLELAANENEEIVYGDLSLTIALDGNTIYDDYFTFEFYDKYREDIEIISVMQDSNELTLNSGKYIIDDPSKEISLKYRFINAKDDRTYDYYFDTFGDNDVYYNDTPLNDDKVYSQRIILDPANEETNYVMHLCKMDAGHNCTKEIVSKRINFILSDYDEYHYAANKIFVTKVMQGGNQITPVYENGVYTFSLNDVENVTLSVKGENLKSDVNYYVGYTGIVGNKWEYISGADLLTGINLTVPTKDNYSIYFEASLPIFAAKIELKYRNNDNVSGVAFNISHNEEIPDYEFDITYKNELACIPSVKGLIQIDPVNYTNKNGIDILINGRNYENKDYDANVIVLDRNGEEIFNDELVVNGAEINDGYRYYLNNLTFLARENIADFSKNYVIIVTLNNATSQMQVAYNSKGSVESKIYYSNDIEVIRNADNPYKITNYKIKYLNRDIINENNQVTLKYISALANQFNDNIIYNYELIKGTMIYADTTDLTNKITLDSGTVRGDVLNETGLNKTINIPNNLNNDDAYMLVIKSGLEIVTYDIIQFRLTEEPMIIVSKLYDGNKEIINSYKSYEFNYYHDVRLHLMGHNFVDNKTYTLTISGYDNKNEHDPVAVDLTGAELNSGYDYLIKAVTDNQIIFGGMTVTISDEFHDIDSLGYSIDYVEKYPARVKINNLKQQSQELNMLNGRYVVTEFAPIIVNYEIENYDSVRPYYIKVIDGFNDTSVFPYDSRNHKYTINFERDQIEGKYVEDPICPVVDGYTFVSRNGLVCIYQKVTITTSDPICPEIQEYDMTGIEDGICNYQHEYQYQIGVTYESTCEGCDPVQVPVYETRYLYETRVASCESGVLNNDQCVLTTVSNTSRDAICQNGSLDGKKCRLDTSDGYRGTYTYAVCSDSECNHPYQSLSFEVDFQMPELLNQSKLYVKKVMQGGNEIILDGNNKYQLNDLETVEITLKGSNLNSETIYSVGSIDNSLGKYTGSELNEGVTVKIYDTQTQCGVGCLNLYLANGSAAVYPVSDEDEVVSLEFSHNSNLVDFNYQLSYLNYQDEEVISEEYHENMYREYLNSNYFNKNNPLKVRITSNVLNSVISYAVRISITKDDQTYYDDTVHIVGSRLYVGYEYFIDNLDLPFNSDVDINNNYKLNIEVDNISHQATFVYNSIGASPRINDRVFYKNEKEHLLTSKGVGGYSWHSAVYDVSDKLFSKHSHVYINFLPENKYQDSVSYTYRLEYFDGDNTYNIHDRESIILKTGTIVGSEFNVHGLTLEINNPNNYASPQYGLIIENGEEVLYMNAPKIELKDILTLTSIRVFANNSDATYVSEDDMYLVPRDRSLYGVISGIGFDDNVDYTINVGHNYYQNINSEADLHTNDIITISGYDLNHDGYRFLIDTDVDYAYTYVVYYSDYNNGDDVYFRDVIKVEYREPDPEVGEYAVNLTYHDEDRNVYYVEPDKFNAKGLDLVINGEEYFDKKYPLSVRITNGENTLYATDINVEGLALNDGYHIYLEDLELSLVTTISDFAEADYNINIVINNIRKRYSFKYNSRGEVIPRVYYNNLSKEAKFMNDSNHEFFQDVFVDLRTIRLSENMMLQNNQLTIKYDGYKFDDEKNYTYEFVSGIDNGDLFEELLDSSVIAEGIITGSTLNNDGIVKLININPNMFDLNTRYLMIIRYGAEIVYYSKIGFEFANTPMITNYDILVDEHIITKNHDNYLLNFYTDAIMKINGINFIENRDYRVIIEEEYEDYCVGDNCHPKHFEYIYNGSIINEGFDYLIIRNDSELTDYKLIHITVIDTVTAEEIDLTNIIIKYATPVYFFGDDNEYEVIEDKSFLDGIAKETMAEQFLENLNPNEDIILKLFDATGSKQITDKIVGTGMLLNVLDLETYEEFYVPIAVRGDTTGDGHVTITDLVKVKKHIVDVNLLDGIYEVAGDVTDTGTITATDLVKIARDVARIEAIG